MVKNNTVWKIGEVYNSELKKDSEDLDSKSEKF